MSTVEAANSLRQLKDNDFHTFLGVSEVLLKYFNNIILNPTETKYRSVRLGNKVFLSKVLPVSGGIECFFAVGFEENDEYLTLPPGDTLECVAYLQKELARERLQMLSNQASIGAPTQSSEYSFHQKLRSSSDHVQHYEDPLLQQKARDLIPLDDLNRKAAARLERISQEDTDGTALDQRDLLLLELLKWFKSRFFRWMDSPRCDVCGGTTRNTGMVEPTAEERRWEAGRVEGYACTQCNRNVRYPSEVAMPPLSCRHKATAIPQYSCGHDRCRYNHPGKLLETRAGRCGEWANCFTLCCRVVGFEARHVVDWTDHVWTEVYSSSQQRWLHCDPCENVCDRPLLYEHGWAKKLSYVIAFSHEEVVDVTWRYTATPQDVISRRTECREDWLMDSIDRLNKEKKQRLSAARVRVLDERFPRELAEFLSVKKVREGEDQGRQSGSLGWRLTRGETTGGQAQNDSPPIYTFKPTTGEQNTKTFHVKYCCASDSYVRVSKQGEVTEAWESCVYRYQNIFRKEEHDWNMVYLAREEGTSRASISWRFDCSSTPLKVDSVMVAASSSTFQTGEIRFSLSDGTRTISVAEGSAPLTEFAGAKSLELRAELSGGEGDVAWQHTQLFRMKSDELDRFPFEWKITLRT